VTRTFAEDRPRPRVPRVDFGVLLGVLGVFAASATAFLSSLASDEERRSSSSSSDTSGLEDLRFCRPPLAEPLTGVSFVRLPLAALKVSKKADRIVGVFAEASCLHMNNCVIFLIECGLKELNGRERIRDEPGDELVGRTTGAAITQTTRLDLAAEILHGRAWVRRRRRAATRTTRRLFRSRL
jgi:hypothetical protein